MKTKKFFSKLTVSSMLVSLLSPLAVLVPQAAAVTDTCTWIGGTDTNFSTAANWSCSIDGTAAPEAGDTLQFTQLATTTTTTNLTNDTPLLEFAGIIVDVTENTTDAIEFYNIDSLMLADGASITKTGTITDTGTMVSSDFNSSGSISIDNNAASVVDWANATWNVNSGTFTLQNNISSNVELRGDFNDVVIGDSSDATIYGSNLGFTLNSLVVGSSMVTFEMRHEDTSPELTFPITVNTSTLVFNKAQWFNATWQTANTNFTISGDMTLNGNVNMWPRSGVTVNVTGAITKNSNVMRYDPYATGVVKVNGQELVPDPVKIASTDKSTAAVSISKNEVVTVNGERGSAFVYDGGTLKGTGTITGTVNVAEGGTVAPGESPGCLTMGGLTIAGNFDVELGGTTECTEYDQAVVNGTVDVTGATLNVSIFGDYAPAVNDAFMIIENDGSDAVTGTFNGLADGATFQVNGVTFQINYNGGDGNDVMLLVTAVGASPEAPDTGLEVLTQNPLVTMFAALAVLGVAGGMKLADNKRK